MRLYLDYDIIKEGNIVLKVPKVAISFKGPGSKIPGFYNPEMAFSRDIAVIFLGYVLDRFRKMIPSEPTLLDALAGSGSRGLRYKKAHPEVDVHLNDISNESVAIIKENARLNALDVTVHNKDFNVLASEMKFSYIDLDPYGTPANFTDALFRGLKSKGFAAITATDTAVLFGTYPKTTLRRYGCVMFRNMFSKEAGVRILILFLLREAGKWDYSIFPHLSYADTHHVRIHISAIKSARKADSIIEKYFGYLIFEEDHTIKFSKEPFDKYIGPLWIGPIIDEDFIKYAKEKVKKYELAREEKVNKMLLLWEEECKINSPYYNIHELAKMYGIKRIPKIEKVIEKLREIGYKASRTHFDPLSVKTNATVRDIIYVSKENSSYI
ncbi:MAG: methyltransferase [Euryarchaeota archaeon]|nr:methyltransferase [Euryarchaeota archaeon]